MKSIEILTNRLASLRDSYQHYTMVDKDIDKAFWIKNDIEEVEILLNELNELKRLKDLEKELGCPLEVMFRALEEGIVINEEGYVNSAYDNEEFNAEEDSHYNWLTLSKMVDDYYFEDINHPYGDSECGDIGCRVKLSDYQKTWWLQGEKNGQ